MTLETPPHALPCNVDELLTGIAEGAAERERDRVPPFDAIRTFARSGAGALRVPARYGGPDATLRTLFELVVRLAEADSNVAQSLRAHFHFVEGRRASSDPAERERWFAAVLEGAIFGNATVERTTRDLFGFETTLTPDGDGDGAVLHGTKYYSTGSLYADWVVVSARTPDGTNAAAVVPTDRVGVTLEDDWDGMGQRLTASGTSRFDHVRVAPEEIVPSAIGQATAAPRGTFLQLYLVAVTAGIGRAVAADGAEVVRRRSRTFSHGSADTPAADPLIQQVAGRLSASAFAVEAAVLAAADALDAAEAAGHDPDAAHEVAVRAAQAQVLAAELVPRAAEQLFDLGGASATSRELDLDRHWRNARTLASHNPAMYKARALGDLLINGERLPANGFF